MAELWVCQLGLTEYRAALELQQRLCVARQRDLIPDTVLVLEHPAVLTRGRRAAEGDLPLPESWYRDQGIDIFDVDRGGKLTYHGPGQLVAYPVVAITDVVRHVRNLEAAVVSSLFEAGVIARTRADEGPDFTGVWVADRKIASIGVHVSHGVTTHGFALNVNMDMAPWGYFTACGLASVTMTSVAEELQRDPACASDLMSCMRKRAGAKLAEAMGARQRLITPQALERALKNGVREATPAPGRTSAGQYA